MLDQYNRNIEYLRISVTDRCNYRCLYCMPKNGVKPISHEEILSYEEILRLVEIAAKIGISKVKITGGEPLVRRDVCNLIRNINKIKGIESVTITTNGALLEDYVNELKEAGISAINVSLDTLNPEKFQEITRCGNLEKVLYGITKAYDAGLPVKINCVPMAGLNEDAFLEIAKLAKDRNISVRFIEMMPIGLGDGEKRIAESQIIKELESAFGTLTQTNDSLGNGPAKYYCLDGFEGHIGFISAMSHEFCSECNRVRLTSDGILKPCLNYESHLDLKKYLRNGTSDKELEDIFREGIYRKPARHGFENQRIEDVHEKRNMSGIGG